MHKSSDRPKRLAQFLNGIKDEDPNRQWRQYRQMLAAYGGGLYVLFPKPFRRLFSWNEGWILVHLINKADTVLSLERNGGWFYYTMEDLAFDTDIDTVQQSRILKSLEDKGLLQRKRIGMPAKRYFRINVFRLNELVGQDIKEKQNAERKRRKKKLKKYKKKVKEKVEKELDDNRFGR